MSNATIIAGLSGTAAERHAYISEMVSVPSGRPIFDKSNFGDETSPEAANMLYQLLKVTAESYALQFVNKGIDTSSTKWKERVDAIDASDNPGLLALKPLIRDWELRQVTRWVTLGGIGDLPSVEAIQAIIDMQNLRSIISATRSIIGNRATNANANLDHYDLTGKTPEQVQAYCDALVASADGNPPGDE